MIRVYGYSDDNVEIEEDGKAVEEIGCFDCEVTLLIGTDEASAGTDASGVYVNIRHDGQLGWLVGIGSPAPNDVASALWPVRVGHEKYSPAVEVDCPRGTPVRGKKRGRGGEWPKEWRDVRDWNACHEEGA